MHDYKCQWCKHVSPTLDKAAQHEREAHPEESAEALYNEVFNPNISDLDYFKSRLKHHGLDK